MSIIKLQNATKIRRIMSVAELNETHKWFHTLGAKDLKPKSGCFRTQLVGPKKNTLQHGMVKAG